MTRHLPAIGFIDSGVGGITIFQAVQQRLPSFRAVYYCDHAQFPYGSKEETQITQLVLKAAGVLINSYKVQCLVVACNTASTFCMQTLRGQYTIPIVGVVPAIKPAAQLTKSGAIAILATEATINGSYLQKLIADFAADKQVIKIAAPTLVELAERKCRGHVVDHKLVKAAIAKLFSAAHGTVDTVVLGCTHFPLLQAELITSSLRPVHWLDSGEAVASRVASILPSMTHAMPLPLTPHLFLQTGSEPVDKPLENWLETLGFGKIQNIPP